MINTFEATLIEKFLIDTNNSFGSLCWYNDMVLGKPEFIEYNTALNWFQKHFDNDYMFLLMTTMVPVMWVPSRSNKYYIQGSNEKSLT